MDRAYSLLTVKAVSDDKRIISGIATSPSPDRMGDIVEPMGLKFANPMPLLLHHQHDKPVGTVRFSKPTKGGIEFQATLPKVEEPGVLKDRVDEAWHSVKHGLIAGVSIGFRPLDFERMKDGGLRFTDAEVLELSLVTIPANADATIQTIKSIDSDFIAASGEVKSVADQKTPPGVTGQSKHPPEHRKVKSKMATRTVAEQISAFEATRAAKAARMAEIMEKSAEEGVTLDKDQEDEYDTLEQEVKSIDSHLVRLSTLEKTNKAAAKPVENVTNVQTGSDTRGGIRVEVKGNNLPKGTAFTRYAMALGAARGSRLEAVEYAKRWHDSTPEVETVLRAAMTAGTTTDADWASPLVEYQNIATEFVELLRPQTILGRIPNLRRVPFNIKVPTQTQGSTVGWVGETAPKPVSELKFGQISLGMAKVAGIVVLSEELVRSSSPSAEAIVRQDLTAAIAKFIDQQFLDPSVAAVTNVSPASISNGITPVVATGTDADAVRADVLSVFRGFATANLSVANGVWIMTAGTALALSMMFNALGQPEFPGLSVNGGTFHGLPVIVSENITGDTTSPTGSRIYLVNASDILLADDGGVTLDVSREASLQMDSSPTNPPVAATVMVSLWQMNLIGLRAERFINWTRRRDEAVAYIETVNYGA